MPKFQPIVLERESLSAPACASCEPSEGLHLYISDPRVIELPEEGCITLRFRRGPVQISEGRGERGGTASVDLTLTEICDVKAEKVEEPSRSSSESENAIDKLFVELRDGDEQLDGDDAG